ncbi:hypothetical protein BC834DRAFT_309836 [Gloeopeniophorella convolvens]|nr:hypothetical protein BC834DRAFT_309836 [Gloeopeniophorella convolvens]
MTTAFFYGTLMHPKILKRVLDNDARHLQLCPALLPDYTRHKVKLEDYPGILPCSDSSDGAQPLDARSVRGVLVAGLTPQDIALLDVFEGSEYVRVEVAAHPLAAYAPVPADTTPTVEASLVPGAPAPPPSPGALQPAVRAQTYVWSAGAARLEDALWEFEDFVRESAWKWIDDAAQENEEFVKVDRVRERLAGVA